MSAEVLNYLLETARQLREEGKDDEAIARYEEARKIDGARPEFCELMELYIRRGEIFQAIALGIRIAYKISGKAERAWDTGVEPDSLRMPEELHAHMLKVLNVCCHVFEMLNKIPDDYLDKNALGMGYFVLALCIADLADSGVDVGALHQEVREKAKACGWSDERYVSYAAYLGALGEEDNSEAIEKLRDRAEKEDPGAWFYVGELAEEKGQYEEAEEAYGHIPMDDPNYVTAMAMLGERDEVGESYYSAFDYFEKALEVAPLNKKLRVAYMRNLTELLLQDSREYGFNKAVIDEATNHIQRGFEILEGIRTKTSRESESAKEKERSSLSDLQANEEMQRFMAKIVQNEAIPARITAQESLAETRDTKETLTKKLDLLNERLDQYASAQEESTASHVEWMREHIAGQMGLSDEKLMRYKEDLKGEIPCWNALSPESRRCLAAGDLILAEGARDMEYSGAAIEYSKALEFELVQNLVDPLVKWGKKKGLGSRLDRSVFSIGRERMTLGNIHRVFTGNTTGFGFLKQFIGDHFRDKEQGQYLLDRFPGALGSIKSIRDRAAHRAKISKGEVSHLRKIILEVLPKLV